jgi:glucose/arabinose dehydrogenase
VEGLQARSRAFLAGAAAAAAIVVGLPASAPAATYPLGFSEQTVFSGLANPTAIRFASDGRVFVAEKSGLVKVFDSLTDTQPDVFADLRTQVHNFWDRGLLGLALDPDFPADPYVYVLYTYDAAIGGTAPRWGTPGATSDGCPTPPGATADGCVVSGRLSRLTASGNSMTGTEQVLIEDWCQQYPSHSIGALDFGPDGALYVTGGDGASFNFVDYGQDGSPLNPCGDPPGGVGAVLTPPTAEGGALRSQDLRTSGDPTSLDGALLRVDPATGAALPDNPALPSADSNARRIVAYGRGSRARPSHSRGEGRPLGRSKPKAKPVRLNFRACFMFQAGIPGAFRCAAASRGRGARFEAWGCRGTRAPPRSAGPRCCVPVVAACSASTSVAVDRGDWLGLGWLV